MKRKVLISVFSAVCAVLLLIFISVAVILMSGNNLTVARCIVTDSGAVYMVYRDRPVLLNYSKDKDVQTGDKVLIVHSSAFAESYPEQTRTHLIIKLKSGNVSDVPKEVLDVLESLNKP